VVLRFIAASVLAVVAFAGPARASEIDGACAGASLLAVIDGTGDLPSPCAVGAGSFLMESLYYQNASKVGGTALAAYPMFRLRAGLARRVELVLDTPSQVAQSGLAGRGLYPSSQPGFGLNYTLAASARYALALRAEARPPASRFAPSEQQSKYSLNATSEYRLTQHFTLIGFLGGSTSRTVGLQHVFPVSALGFGFDPNARTEISTDLGARFLARHASPQSFGDVSVSELLQKTCAFQVGLGTTLNPVSNAKAHYLAAGFDFRP
jgi:hypothetical protein